MSANRVKTKERTQIIPGRLFIGQTQLFLINFNYDNSSEILNIPSHFWEQLGITLGSTISWVYCTVTAGKKKNHYCALPTVRTQIMSCWMNTPFLLLRTCCNFHTLPCIYCLNQTTRGYIIDTYCIPFFKWIENKHQKLWNYRFFPLISRFSVMLLHDPCN